MAVIIYVMIADSFALVLKEGREKVEVNLSNTDINTSSGSDLGKDGELGEGENGNENDNVGSRFEISFKKLDDIKKVSQMPTYPTGCEIVALEMFLDWYGVDISTEELYNNLDRSELPKFDKSLGYVVADHPNESFIGDPKSRSGYGVFIDPVVKLAEKHTGEGSIERLNGIESIIRKIDSGKPVVTWVTIGMVEPYEYSKWNIRSSGEEFRWLANEHAVLVVGYDNNNVYYLDPTTGKKESVGISSFKKRFDQLGNMAFSLR